MSPKTKNWLIGIVVVLILAGVGSLMQKKDNKNLMEQEKVTKYSDTSLQINKSTNKYKKGDIVNFKMTYDESIYVAIYKELPRYEDYHEYLSDVQCKITNASH